MPKADIWSNDTEGQSESTFIDSLDHSLDGSGAAVDLTTSDPIDSPLIPEVNEDPFRRRIANRKRGLINWLKKQLGAEPRQPTMAEIAEMDDQQRLKLLEKTLRDESQIAAERLSNALDRMGFSHRRYNGEGELRKLQKVRFDFVLSTEDAHWLHVNMDRLPYGVNSSSIIEQRVLDDLGKAVGHKVNLRATDEAGIWYVIERASGMMGIPIHVYIQDMWRRFPASANSLTLPVGMTTNRKLVYESVDTMVHALIAGETGGGKSNAQNTIISTLISRNSPSQLQMLLMDMKAGLEFQFYEDVPHLVKIEGVTDSGIIEHPDKVYPAFEWLINKEAARRMSIIRAAKHRSIDDYNIRRKRPMPRMLVVCDEWGIARLGSKGKEAEIELSKSVMLLRAVGIHIHIGTQTPTKEVLGLLVRSNLPTKIAFNCNELSASTIVVGNSLAMGLPVGRAIFKRGMQTVAVQWPYISEEMVKSIVASVREGRPSVQIEDEKTYLAKEEILSFGLHALGGGLQEREIYKHFSARGVSQIEVRRILQEVEGQEVIVDGKLYIVQPGAGTRPRTLVAKQESENEIETL